MKYDGPGRRPEMATTPAPATGGPRPVGRRAIVVAVVAAIVLAGVVVGLIVVSGPGAPAPPTVRAARATMNGTIDGLAGGGWALLSAFGLDQRGGATLNVSALVARAGSACTATAVGTTPVPTAISVAAYAGSLAAGRAPFWLFLYRQPLSGEYLLGDVLGGAGAPVAYLTGTDCTGNLSSLAPVPTDLVDSPTIAASAWNGDGAVNASAFVRGDPAISGLLLLATGSFTEDGTTFSGWGLEYTPCAPFQGGSLVQATTYVAAFSPTGTAYGATTATTGCPSG